MKYVELRKPLLEQFKTKHHRNAWPDGNDRQEHKNLVQHLKSFSLNILKEDEVNLDDEFYDAVSGTKCNNLHAP